MWAARPHLANIFEKLLDQKTFFCLRQKNCRQFDLAATSFDLFCSYFI